jgi:hypothetical protein
MTAAWSQVDAGGISSNRWVSRQSMTARAAVQHLGPPAAVVPAAVGVEG